MSWDKSDYWLPQLRYRKQLFHGPPPKMMYSPTYDGHFSRLSSFSIPQFFRNRYNYLLLSRGVMCPFLKAGNQPFHGPVALVSSLSKLITTLLGTNTMVSLRGMLANTASVLSHYCLLNHTLFQMDSFVKGPPNL